MGQSTLSIITCITGYILFLCLLYRLVSFIYIYVRPSSLKKYLTEDAYALVTGATDGIGKAIAMELASKGFNLIIHGRSENKCNQVKAEILLINPSLKVVTLIQDGSKENKPYLAAIQSLPITILVNNVGIGPIKEFYRFSPKEIDEVINLNILFPTHMTHSLLPYLSRPSLILNISSYAGLYPPPYISVYAATKSYNDAFSQSLSVELKETETLSLITGSVQTGSNRKAISFFRPTSKVFAKSVLAVIGVKRKRVIPYWPHAVQIFITSLLPASLIDKVMRRAMLNELK